MTGRRNSAAAVGTRGRSVSAFIRIPIRIRIPTPIRPHPHSYASTHASPPTVAIVLLIALVAGRASADLGAPVLDRTEGPYRVMLFASPSPLRAGDAALTLAVLDAPTGRPAEGVRVDARLAPPPREGPAGGDAHAEHGHGADPDGAIPLDDSASGPVRSARVTLPSAGDWHLVVAIAAPPGDPLGPPAPAPADAAASPAHPHAHGHEADPDPTPSSAPATVLHAAIEVAPPRGFWREDGLAVVAPYAAIAVWALHRARFARRRRGRGANG